MRKLKCVPPGLISLIRKVLYEDEEDVVYVAIDLFWCRIVDYDVNLDNLKNRLEKMFFLGDVPKDHVVIWSFRKPIEKISPFEKYYPSYIPSKLKRKKIFYTEFP